MREKLFVFLLAQACSDYKFVKHDDADGGADDTGIESDDTGDTGDPLIGACEVPEISGSFHGFTDTCPDAPEGGRGRCGCGTYRGPGRVCVERSPVARAGW